MKKIILTTVLLVVIVGISAPVQADITAWIGRTESDDLFIEGTNTIGGAVGFSFLKYFAVEMVVDYAPDSELPFNLEELEQLFGVNFDVDMLFVTGNVLVQYPAGGFTPYFTTGYGGFGIRLSSDLLEDLEDELSGSTVFNYGFGAKIDVAPFFAIRGEWRSYRLSFDPEGLDDIFVSVKDPTFSRLAIGASITF